MQYPLKHISRVFFDMDFDAPIAGTVLRVDIVAWSVEGGSRCLHPGRIQQALFLGIEFDDIDGTLRG
jgi:hypothetical protein